MGRVSQLGSAGSLEGLAGRLRGVFAADPRSLAVFRIGVGAILLADLWLRGRFLPEFYTDAGLLPRVLLRESAWHTVAPFHLLEGSLAFQALLFGLHALFALALLVGYRTRIAAVGAWLLLVSMQIRNPILNNYGDDILRVVFFWSLFLPLGRCWSVDAWRRGEGVGSYRPVLSAASVALLLQVGFVYFFSALMKTGADWWGDGTAIYYALSQDWRTLPLGRLLLGYPELLRLLTHATMVLELLGPPLLLSPFATGPVRTLTVAAFWSFHVGLGLAIYIGPVFPFVSCTVLAAVLPPWFWERVLRLRAAAPEAAPSAAPEGGGARALVPSWSGAVVALLLAYTVVYNIGGYGRVNPEPDRLTYVGHLLRLNQKWRMYTPNGPRVDGWYVMPGRLANGETVDLDGPGTGPLSFEKPQSLASRHVARMQIYLWRMHYPEMGPHRRNYARWRCREWNREHEGGERLERLEIYWMDEPTPPPDTAPHAERKRLLVHRCRPRGPGPAEG